MSSIDLENAHKVVGERLRRTRRAAKKSLSEMAAEAGISAKELSEIERGKVEFHLLTLLNLCGAYGVAPGKLLEGFDFGPANGNS